MQSPKKISQLFDSQIDGIYNIARFKLKSAIELRDIKLAYRLHGDPCNPLVVVLGGISAHRGLNSSAANKAGWWPEFVGPGLAIDTCYFCVLSIDYLGGSGDSSGPHEQSWPESTAIHTEDQARLVHELCQYLGIHQVYHWIGASYGGMVGLAFASLFPTKLRKLTVISAAHRAHPMAMAWRYIQREIVALGKETGRQKRSLALARALAMTSYRTPEEFAERFQHFSEVAAYLEHTGQRYAETTKSEAFSCLSRSIDEHTVHVSAIEAELDIIGFWEDRLVPADILKELAELTNGRLRLFHSIFGHDAFLKESKLLTELLSCQGENT